MTLEGLSAADAVLPLVVFLAFVVETAAGFGSAVVTVTLASLFLPLTFVLAAFVPVNVLLSTYLVLRYRASVDRPILLRRLLPMMTVGMVIGMALFHLRGQGWLKGAFGAFVVTLAAVELLRMRRPQEAVAPLAPLAATSALLGAGVIHGIFACGGPLLVYVAGREITDKARFRATLSAVWLLLNLALLVNYRIEGTLSAETLRTSLLLLPALVAGILAGEWVHQRLLERTFRLAVFTLLLFAGGALLARTILVA